MHTAAIVQRAIDYIEEHLDEPLELEQIAEAAAMSVPNLYRMFYAVTGHPIKEYIRKRRTSEAACLLRHTGLPAIEIGFRCGFDTYQTFTKSFKRTTGLTPGLYRRAGLIYSFERIDTNEYESYLEEREVSERYPDVKVIRLDPRIGIGCLHAAEHEEGLEAEAVSRFRALLTASENLPGRMRIFGWNVGPDRESEKPYGYQMAAVCEIESDCERLPAHPDLRPIELPGGLYAVSRTPAGSGTAIVGSWNRLLSEWLPRSTFELGEHGFFLEEYQPFGSHIARMKLYLPVKRGQEPATIGIGERPPVTVISFRAEGADCVTQADKASVDWLTRHDFAGDGRLRIFMSCSFPQSESESSFYNVYLSLPENFIPSEEDSFRVTRLEGGLYASLTTKAYGSMTGVLERIYRWLGTSSEYAEDEERFWYVSYMPAGSGKETDWAAADWERSVTVECCVPVISKHK